MSAPLLTPEQSVQWYDQMFQSQHEKGNGGEVFIKSLQAAAFTRFRQLGFPHRKAEAWKYTNVAPMVKIPFKPAWRAEQRPLTPADVRPWLLRETAGHLVFVDGRFAAELSALPEEAEGFVIQPLSAMLASNPGAVERHLGQYQALGDNVFAALNTAFLQDGLYCAAQDGAELDRPVQALFISTGREENLVSYPRNLCIADASSRFSIVESYAGMAGNVYQTNAVTELVVGENAQVDHCKLQQEDTAAYHLAALHVRQERNSVCTQHNLSFGGRLSRNDITVLLDGEGGHCTLNGLYIGRGEQHMDSHTRIEHVRPHCTSEELYRGILDDAAHGVFNGKIYVHPHAVKTDAIQANNNILLSEHARADAKPELEIYADDVKCTHGGTVGALDENAAFYMRSRGIPEKTAKVLLLRAFAGSVTDRLRQEPLRDRVQDLVTECLGQPRE